jgi:hypothetical protein
MPNKDFYRFCLAYIAPKSALRKALAIYTPKIYYYIFQSLKNLMLSKAPT